MSPKTKQIRNPPDVPLISGMNVVVSPRSSANLTQNLNAHSVNNLSIRYMNKSNLSKLSKDQLIALLLEKQRPIPLPRVKKVTPIPKPRKSVKQMVQNYENTIIKPPRQFMDKPKVAPKKKKVTPIPKPRTQITQLRSAFHKYTNSYEIGIKIYCRSISSVIRNKIGNYTIFITIIDSIKWNQIHGNNENIL